MRDDGWLIEGYAHGESDWKYVLIRDNRGKARVDWYTQQFGPRPAEKAKDELPLFELVP
jgi:hypothetical protein